uniref:Uncharacterized protein n=1 Tax=Oryza glumipatula TaxID=40148 RepID=A0A0E0AL49_9ORYZ
MGAGEGAATSVALPPSPSLPSSMGTSTAGAMAVGDSASSGLICLGEGGGEAGFGGFGFWREGEKTARRTNVEDEVKGKRTAPDKSSRKNGSCQDSGGTDGTQHTIILVVNPATTTATTPARIITAADVQLGTPAKTITVAWIAIYFQHLRRSITYATAERPSQIRNAMYTQCVRGGLPHSRIKTCQVHQGSVNMHVEPEITRSEQNMS